MSGMNCTVQDVVRPDVTSEQNAVACPRCDTRGTWATFDGITYCTRCRFWYAGYGPYKPVPTQRDALLLAMGNALQDLMEWRQFGARLCNEYRKQGRDPAYIPLCPTESAMEKTERVQFALAKQITEVRKSNEKVRV